MASPDPFAAIDESKISRFQYKIMCVSGMGFFTDAEGDPAESLVSAAKDANLLVLGRLLNVGSSIRSCRASH